MLDVGIWKNVGALENALPNMPPDEVGVLVVYETQSVVLVA